MTREINKPPSEFKVPRELLNVFQHDMRFVPNHLPVAGYIIFDHEMLKAILLNPDAKARANFAANLGALNAAGGELVIVARSTEVGG